MAQHDETLRVRVVIDPQQVRDEASRAFDQVNRDQQSKARASSNRDTYLQQSGKRDEGHGGALVLAGGALNAIGELANLAFLRKMAGGANLSQFTKTNDLVREVTKTTQKFGDSITRIAGKTGVKQAESDVVKSAVATQTSHKDFLLNSVILAGVRHQKDVHQGFHSAMFEALQPGDIPPLTPNRPPGQGGGLGGGGGGGFGGLFSGGGRALPYGIIAAIAAATIANLRSAASQMSQGRNQMLMGSLTSNPSEALKGWGKFTSAPLQAALGPLGPVVSKLTEKFDKLIDGADKLIEQWSHLNASIAWSAAQLRLAQIQGNIRVASGFAPLAKAYNELKAAITGTVSRVGETFGKVMSVLLAPIIKGMTIVEKIFGAGLEKLLTKLNAALDKLLGKIGIDNDEKMAKGEFIRRYTAAFKTWQYPTTQGEDIRSRTGGVNPRIHTGLMGGSIGRQMKDQKALMERIKEDQRILSEQNSGVEMKKYASEDLKRAQAQLSKTHIRHIPEVPALPPGVVMPQSQKGPIPQKPVPQTQPSAHSQNMDVRQTIHLTMQSKITHDKQVHESMMQIRDELIRVVKEAKNEARLALAIASPVNGAII